LCYAATSSRSLYDKSFDNFKKFTYLGTYDIFTSHYLGTPVTNIDQIRDEIRRRMNYGNAYYSSMENCFTPYTFQNA
jgi:hypothetical protein